MEMRNPKKASRCEDCLYYDTDDETGAYDCQLDLDEDDMVQFLNRNTASCPYYRYYDEYKSVQKQN